MVDTISSAKGIRHGGVSRYGASPASSPTDDKSTVAPVSPASGASHREQDAAEQDTRREGSPENQDLRLEIAEDDEGKELVYRFVDAKTGMLIREWDAGEFGKLRDYVREKKIHLLDRKI